MKRCLLAMLMLSLLCGCSLQEQGYESTFFAMDTVMELRIFGADDAPALARAVSAEIQVLENLLSVTKEDSELARLNRGDAVSLSGETRELLDGAAALHARTGGLLDPTVYPIVKLWGFTTGEHRVPSQSERDAARQSVGLEHLHDDAGTLTLSDGAQLDFGAVAKGYAADKAAQLLSQAGVSAILTLGGNIQTVGKKPDGSLWRIGITDPTQPERSIASLSFSGDRAVVTSGGYQRYFEEAGARYSHIMDPRTGAPAMAGLASVTIVAERGLLADGLSTALYIMGLADAEAFWRASDDFEMVLITDAGEVYVTKALESGFSCEGEYQVIER